jgi:D-serine deaminase-like pyridoxal phosphate-dependent protein
MEPAVALNEVHHLTKRLTKEELGTPALILDLDILEENLRAMADRARAAGLHLRPHVKVHKCPEVSKRQITLGAIGITAATIAECELMHAAGIRGILHSCQPAGKNKIGRAVALAQQDSTALWVADNPLTVDQLNEAAAAAGATMNVLVDVYAGLSRQGIQPGPPALALAQRIDQASNLRFAGLMGYSGYASHLQGFEERRQRSMADLEGLNETVELCRKAGLEVPIRTGGSTGTYNIDAGWLTEIQCGSYVFMDTVYRQIGGRGNPQVFDDFRPALTVLTTVISRTRPNQCSIDAGNKAMLRVTDQVKDRPGVTIENQGAEYGMLLWNDGDWDLKPGDRVEIYPSNLDTSTNAYDRYYVTRGEQIVDVWPIMGRAGAAQR